MRINISKQVYDQLPIRDQQSLVAVDCRCKSSEPKGIPEADCDSCGGDGTIWEMQLSAEDSAAIQDNLRRQGVPLGKIGTN